MRVSQGRQKRLRAIEKALKPSPPKPLPPFTITVEYADGHIDKMSAARYRKEKQKYHDKVQMLDFSVTGNTDELREFLGVTEDEALYELSEEEHE